MWETVQPGNPNQNPAALPARYVNRFESHDFVSFGPATTTAENWVIIKRLALFGMSKGHGCATRVLDFDIEAMLHHYEHAYGEFLRDKLVY